MLPWTFTGQPQNEWPRCVIASNYAAAYDRSRFLMHQYEGVLEVRRGDILDRKLTGEFYVIGRPEALQASEKDFEGPERHGQRISPTGLWLPPGAIWAPLADDPTPETPAGHHP